MDANISHVKLRTKSACRRKRAAAVRERMWQALQPTNSHPRSKMEQSHGIDELWNMVSSKLTYLESLIFDIHWTTLGQWQQPWFDPPAEEIEGHWDVNNCGSPGCFVRRHLVGSSGNVVDHCQAQSNFEDRIPTSIQLFSDADRPQVENNLSDPCAPFRYHAGGQDFQAYRLWSPGTKHFIKQGSTLEDELVEEAATKLQRQFKKCIARKLATVQGSCSDASSEIPDVCTSCGEEFSRSQLHEDYPDRCDKCAAFAHTSCLFSYEDDRGEWNVCASCYPESVSPPAANQCGSHSLGLRTGGCVSAPAQEAPPSQEQKLDDIGTHDPDQTDDRTSNAMECSVGPAELLQSLFGLHAKVSGGRSHHECQDSKFWPFKNPFQSQSSLAVERP